MRLLFWSISLLTFVGWATGRILYPGNIDFPLHSFFLKYALDIFFLNFAVLMFIFPFLIENGVIGRNYHEEDEVGKAKYFLVSYTIILPGLTLVFLAALISGTINLPYCSIMILFWYSYIKNSYVYFVKRG